MTRVMYDTVTASVIPSGAQMVAGYDDGAYRWSAADWARFPNAVHVHIAVHPSTNSGHVLDVERGDASPSEAPGWVLMRRQAGQHPTVYCSLAVWDAVRAAFRAAGVVEPEYWIAAYPGIGAKLYPGSVAHQYADVGPAGENVDVSVVADYWPGVDQEDDMTPAEMEAAVQAALLAVFHGEGLSGGTWQPKLDQTNALLTELLAAVKAGGSGSGTASGTLKVNLTGTATPQ